MEQAAVALAAGMLAAVNPCGFALLPAYLSFLVLGNESTSRAKAVLNAVGLTAAMTLGFAAVFGVFGLVIAPIAGSIQQHLPWFTIVLGVALVALGVWLLAGRELPTLKLPTRSGKGPITRSATSMIAFGASYAIASIGCTIGPFIAIVVGSFRAGSTLEGIGLFVAYALGMGITVGIAAVAVAIARTSLVRRLRMIGSVLPRIAGGLMAVVGAYVAYYGWYELRVFNGGDANDPIIGFGEDVQRVVSNVLDGIGAPTLAAVLVVLIAATILLTRPRRQKERDGGT